MTSRLKKILCILLSISMLCSIPVFAVEKTAAETTSAARAIYTGSITKTTTFNNNIRITMKVFVSTQPPVGISAPTWRVDKVSLVAWNYNSSSYCNKIVTQYIPKQGLYEQSNESKTFYSPGNSDIYYFYNSDKNFYTADNWGDALLVNATFYANNGKSIMLQAQVGYDDLD
ncbi:MAG: hypothetical protein ACLSAP_02100 [Oscillospiraceae bacterium]